MLKNTISFIGCGNIATAIMSGIIKSGYINPTNIFGYDIDESRKNIVKDMGVNIISSIEDAAEADYVFVTIKPQICPQVLPLLKNKVNGCLVSVVAGLKILNICNYLGNIAVVRVMPNTPIMVGSGAAGICKNNLVSDVQFNFVKGIFDSCGISCAVEEELMDVITGLSGSGPAYVFRFINALCEQAIELGLQKDDALQLACATLRGAADMLEISNMSANELIKMVSSPNGTTVAGLSKLDELGFDDAVKACVKAATARSIELS